MSNSCDDEQKVEGLLSCKQFLKSYRALAACVIFVSVRLLPPDRVHFKNLLSSLDS